MKRKKKWTIDQLKVAVKNSTSYRQVISKLGLIEAGGNYDQVKKYIKENSFSIIHFKGRAWNKDLILGSRPILSLESILVKNSNYQSYKLKNRLFEAKLKTPKCEKLDSIF